MLGILGVLGLAAPAVAETPDAAYSRLLPFTNAITQALPGPRMQAAPSDSLLHPYVRFAFLYEDGAGNRIDTIDGTLTKDLGDAPDKTIHFRFNERQLRVAYAGLLKVGFFELPGRPDFLDSLRTRGAKAFHELRWIRIAARTDSTVHDVTWNDDYPYQVQYMPDDMLRLHDWINEIWIMAVESPDVRRMPPARHDW